MLTKSPQRQPASAPKDPSANKAATQKNSVIVGDGLRYKHKAAGSPFGTSQAGFGTTMSCFKCGVHRSASELESKKMLGGSKKVCKGGCQKA